MKIEVTDIYRKYQKSHDYMQKKNLVRRTDRCWDMYVGNQWKNLQTGGEELPIMNMIQPIVKYKVSTIAQNAMTANFTDSEQREELVDIFKLINKKFLQSWEKAKMDDVKWKMNKYSAVQGDTYCLFWSQNTQDMPQILQNTSVLFGDENISDIQKQPYIIIRERLRLKDVQEEAKKNGIPKDTYQMIATDDDTEDEIQNKDEVSDKVTSYLYFERDENGVVQMCKSTKTCIYRPMAPFVSVNDSGDTVGRLKSYPIVPLIWEPIPNSMRGSSEVEKLIPNQIELNKTLARRAVAVRMYAFPRLAYDKSAIENPKDLMKVGAAIGIQGGGAQSINQMISYLSPANSSSDAQALFSDLLLQTKDLDGAGDMALGNINPERTSGEAITAIRDQTQIPLNEQVKLNAQFVEDVANLWLDMWTTWDVAEFTQPKLSPLGEPVYENEQPMTEMMSMKEIEGLKPSIRIDVSEDNRWTRLSEQQALDNLLQQGHITFDEYVELAPENSVLPNGKLKKLLEKRQMQEQQMMQAQMMQPNEPLPQ